LNSSGARLPPSVPFSPAKSLNNRSPSTPYKTKSHAPLQEHGVSKVLFQFNYLTKVLRRVSSHPPGCIVLPFFVRIYASRVYLGDQRLAETGFYSF
jgi:hypothetical protein